MNVPFILRIIYIQLVILFRTETQDSLTLLYIKREEIKMGLVATYKPSILQTMVFIIWINNLYKWKQFLKPNIKFFTGDININIRDQNTIRNLFLNTLTQHFKLKNTHTRRKQ